MTQWFTARFPGQIVDAGPLAPVGHGIGMAIGAQLARPGKQVVVVIGDGGLGIGGWDIETALRYDLPVHTVLWNNSSWGPSFEQMPLLKGRTDPFNMLDGHPLRPDVRGHGLPRRARRRSRTRSCPALRARLRVRQGRR